MTDQNTTTNQADLHKKLGDQVSEVLKKHGVEDPKMEKALTDLVVMTHKQIPSSEDIYKELKAREDGTTPKKK